MGLVGRIGIGVLKMVIGALVLDCICTAAENIADGKTILGHKKPMPKKTKVGWNGYIYAGTNDATVE